MTLKMNLACPIHTGFLAAVLTVAAILAATPTFAQTVNLPTLQFPEAETSWGCMFFGTCPSRVITQDGS